LLTIYIKKNNNTRRDKEIYIMGQTITIGITFRGREKCKPCTRGEFHEEKGGRLRLRKEKAKRVHEFRTMTTS